MALLYFAQLKLSLHTHHDPSTVKFFTCSSACLNLMFPRGGKVLLISSMSSKLFDSGARQLEITITYLIQIFTTGRNHSIRAFANPSVPGQNPKLSALRSKGYFSSLPHTSHFSHLIMGGQLVRKQWSAGQ